MPVREHIRRWALVAVIAGGGLAFLLGYANGPGTAAAPAAPDAYQYPLTIASLQVRYRDEMQAQEKYTAYADKARSEDYAHIAYLFDALAYSESVHARNFARELTNLGVEVEKLPEFEYEVLKTRDNIRHATAVEMDEIAHRYPGILEEIEAEQHEEAIQFITYAWEAERQHRDLLKKIQSAAKKWFGMLAAHIEGEAAHYYVCEVCGSTLTALPAESCPICEHPTDNYTEVPGFPAEEDDY